MHQQYVIALLLHGFVPVETCLLISCDTAIYAITTAESMAKIWPVQYKKSLVASAAKLVNLLFSVASIACESTCLQSDLNLI